MSAEDAERMMLLHVLKARQHLFLALDAIHKHPLKVMPLERVCQDLADIRLGCSIANQRWARKEFG